MAAPWLYGGVWADTQYFLFAGMLGSLTIWTLASVWVLMSSQRQITRLPLVLLPISCGLVLGAYQLSHSVHSLSANDIQKSIASSIAKASNENARSEDGRDALISAMQSERSIAPAATRLEVARFIFAIVTLFLACQLFSAQASQLWLWAALTANGSAVALFGIAQQLSWNGKMFWTFPMRNGGQPFASFVNRNNAAGYLLLCLAGALGLAVWQFARSQPLLDVTGIHTRRNTRLSMRRRNLSERISQLVSELTASHLMIGTSVVLITTGIVLTTSRGGWLALAVATVALGPALARSHRLSAIAFVFVMGFFSIALVGWTGMGDRVSRRWSQVASADAIAGDGRWAHWSDSIRVLSDFPLTGTGFGTYRFAYLPYQTHATTVRFYNADNQFLEWLVEGGTLGLAAVLVSILLIAIACWSLLNRLRLEHTDPVAIVGLFALVSQCVSGFFDYGPTMPANTLALAAIIGAVTGRAALLAAQNHVGVTRFALILPTIRPALVIPILGAVLLVLGFQNLREVEAAAGIDVVTRRIPKLDSPDAVDSESVDHLIDALSSALDKRLDDAEAHQSLAELWIYKFRQQEFQNAMKLDADTDKSNTWKLTDPLLAYEQIHIWQSTGQDDRVDSLTQLPMIRAHFAPAYAHLIHAIAACPMIPDVDRLLATIAFVEPEEPKTGELYLRRALIVAPVDPNVLYEVGCMAHVADLRELSFDCWRRSLVISPRHLFAIHRLLSEKFSIDEQLELVIPASPDLLLKLGESYRDADHIADRHKFAERALSLLSADTSPPLTDGTSEAGRHRNLGRSRLLLGESSDAVAEYQRALAITPKQIDWRLELIEILIQRNELLAALKEAEVCQVYEPGRKQHQVLVRNLREKIPSERKRPNSSTKQR